MAVPFASPNGLYNLSRLLGHCRRLLRLILIRWIKIFAARTVCEGWLRLGIAIERIRPGHPQQNGRHERMHLTLKKETTRPARANHLAQQVRFDDFS